MLRRSIFFVAVIILALWQISFWYEFSLLRVYVSPIILIAIILSVWRPIKTSLVFILIAGIVLDIYSVYAFGIITVSLLIVYVFIRIIFMKLFARKTVYALTLTIASGTMLYHLTAWLLANGTYWIGWSEITMPLSMTLARTVIGQAVVHALIAVTLYSIIKILKRKTNITPYTITS